MDIKPSKANPDQVMSHDRNFKNLILDLSHQALAFFAAAEADGIDAARITPVRQEQQQERLGERFRELDVPPLENGPTGGARPCCSCSKKRATRDASPSTAWPTTAWTWPS